MQMLTQSLIFFPLQLKIRNKNGEISNFQLIIASPNAVTISKFLRLIESRLLCSNTPGRKEDVKGILAF